MEEIVKQGLHAALQEFLEDLPAADAAMLSTPDGLLVTEASKVALEMETVAAMSASLISIGDALASQTGRPNSEQVITESANGIIAVVHAGKLVLTTMAKKETNLGMLLSYTSQCATKITSVTENAIAETKAAEKQAAKVAEVKVSADKTDANFDPLVITDNHNRADPQELLRRVLREMEANKF
ncbi:MAG: roadblock/LC7 domain-containing protein [Mariprofundales bacterium]